VASVLYTPEVLGLTITLARHPLTDDLTLRAEARSKSCGSTIALGLALDGEGRIERVGVRSQACAVGQAAAAIFADAAAGLTAAQVDAARGAIRDWLAGEGALPAWPGLAAIAAARDYPGRHGAVLLAWNAAAEALATAPARG
jgi:NifU-like protein involved in Fe-S cluster formation